MTGLKILAVLGLVAVLVLLEAVNGDGPRPPGGPA